MNEHKNLETGIIEFDHQSMTGRVFAEYVLRYPSTRNIISSFIFDDKREDINLSDLIELSNKKSKGKIAISVKDDKKMANTDILFIFGKTIENYIYSLNPNIDKIKDYVHDFFYSFEPIAKNLYGYKGLLCFITGYHSLIPTLMYEKGWIKNLDLDTEKIMGFCQISQIKATEIVKKRLNKIFPDKYVLEGSVGLIGTDIQPADIVLSTAFVNDKNLDELKLYNEEEKEKLTHKIHQYQQELLLNKNFKNRDKMIAKGLNNILRGISGENIILFDSILHKK